MRPRRCAMLITLAPPSRTEGAGLASKDGKNHDVYPERIR